MSDGYVQGYIVGISEARKKAEECARLIPVIIPQHYTPKQGAEAMLSLIDGVLLAMISRA